MRSLRAEVAISRSRNGSLRARISWGRIEIPLAVGVVGGMTRLHPMARIALKMLHATRAGELARICAAVGLVQNLGALRALASVGIVNGHMKLHAANLAIAAGADIHEIAPVRERITQMLKSEKRVGMSQARAALEAVRLSIANAPSSKVPAEALEGVRQ